MEILIVNAAQNMPEHKSNLLNICIEHNMVRAYLIAVNQTRNLEIFDNITELLNKFLLLVEQQRETVYYLIVGLVDLAFENYIDDKYCVRRNKFLAKLYEQLFNDATSLKELMMYDLCVIL